MTTTKPATGKTAEQEYETLLFELRAGGFTQEQLDHAEEGLRRAGAAFAAGSEISGPFEYVLDGANTWASYPISSTATDRERTQVTEAFDGITTVTTDTTQNVVQKGDHRTFSGHPLLQVSLFGSVPAWLSETGSEPNGDGETVTYEGNDRAGFHRRLVVVYAGSGRTRVVSAKEGFVLPEENLKPGQAQFQVASQVARPDDGTTVTMDFLVGGKPSQRVTIAVEGQSAEASFDLLRGIGKGHPIIDMRLGAKAPVNYAFSGSLPSEDSMSSPSVAAMSSGGRISWVLVGIIGSALAVWLWKRK